VILRFLIDYGWGKYSSVGITVFRAIYGNPQDLCTTQAWFKIRNMSEPGLEGVHDDYL